MASHDNWWNSVFNPQDNAERQRTKSYSGWTDPELSAGFQRNRLKALIAEGSIVGPWPYRAAKDSANKIWGEQVDRQMRRGTEEVTARMMARQNKKGK